MAGTGTAYPSDAVAGSPQYAALQGRNAFSAIMGGATTAKPLGGTSGVRPGTRSDLITATSSVWTMNPLGCSGYIELESSTTNSGYFFAFSGTVTGSVSAAEASARVDLVYVQINDSNTSDGSSGAPRVVMDYQKGTAGAGVPTLTAARAFVIAQINVPATGGGSPTVTWVAPYASAAGGVLFCNTASQLPATASLGDRCLAYDTGVVYRWDGSAWRNVFRDTFVVPSTVVVGSGSYVINADGSITVTGASNVRFDGVCPAGVTHCAAEVAIDTATVSTSLNVRMCVGGTPQTGATDYRFEVGIVKGTTTTVPANSTGNSSAQLSDTGLSFYGRIDLYNANKALATYMMADLVAGVSGASPTRTTASGFWGLATAADGIQFIPAAGGTISGTFAFRSL